MSDQIFQCHPRDWNVVGIMFQPGVIDEHHRNVLFSVKPQSFFAEPEKMVDMDQLTTVFPEFVRELTGKMLPTGKESMCRDNRLGQRKTLPSGGS